MSNPAVVVAAIVLFASNYLSYVIGFENGRGVEQMSILERLMK